jgi:MoaA/NifB/PqqE/SkfB family radical SAM enzyme
MTAASSSPNVPSAFVFDRAPRRVYWEVTRACSLACRHCRAVAAPRADADELTSAEGRRLLGRLAAFDPKPKVILTGGDPIERADLFDLIAEARGLGLGVSVSPSATAKLTPEIIARLVGAGVEAISLSLDGAAAGRHDVLRGVPGCFDRTLAAGRAAARLGLAVQVNTLVCAETADDLPAVYALVAELGASRWSLFFLVSVGRGAELEPLDAPTATLVLAWVAGLPADRGPVVTTTEAPHYRRILIESGRLSRGPEARAGFGVRDGNGVMFISHRGDVSPSGFLPLSAGNIRVEDPVGIYRDSALFRRLRDPSTFGGRCGVCEFHGVCGGSRARAWSSTGDAGGDDPLCTHEPKHTRPPHVN